MSTSADRPASTPFAAGTDGAHTMVLERVYDAPPEVVFDAWTDARKVAQWWGPRGWTAPECTVDARVGGHWRLLMRSPADFFLAKDGEPYDQWVGGEYRVVDRPRRLVLTTGFINEPRIVEDYVIDVRLEDAGEGRTRLIGTLIPTSAEQHALLLHYEAPVGWGQTLDMLGEFVAARS